MRLGLEEDDLKVPHLTTYSSVKSKAKLMLESR
jgi:hypothetical protein